MIHVSTAVRLYRIQKCLISLLLISFFVLSQWEERKVKYTSEVSIAVNNVRAERFSLLFHSFKFRFVLIHVA